MRVSRVLPVAAVTAVVCLPLAACGDEDKAPASGSASGETGSGSVPIDTSTVAPTASLSPQEAQAVSSYKTYVRGQLDDSITKTKEFVDAVKAGDVAKAKSLYAPSRVGWESIEPVAESFGDLDPRVDLREADLEAGQTWTGWHVIEKALWQGNTTEGMGPVADQLIADLEELVTRVRKVEITPTSMAQRRQGAAGRGRHRQDHRRGGGVQPHRLRRHPGERRRRPQGLSSCCSRW